MVSAPSPQSQGSPVSCLIQEWSWVFPAQSHIQYSAGNKPLFSTHANSHPALVSRTSQRREGENVTFRGHILIPFCFISLPFRKTTNPPHHVEVEILWGGTINLRSKITNVYLMTHLMKMQLKPNVWTIFAFFPPFLDSSWIMFSENWLLHLNKSGPNNRVGWKTKTLLI